jgi:competence protein ComEA
MFRRQTSPGGDVVAAARRRLAALAEQHDPVPKPALSAEDAQAESAPTRSDGSAVGSEGRARPAARHVGTRRTEYGRWEVSGQHVTVAALCVVLLVVVVAWWALRSVPQAEQVNLSSQRVLPTPGVEGTHPSFASASSVGGGAPIGPTASGGTAGSSRLVIDVAGRVRHPGIVELPPGSRVVDAIAAAGGARPGVPLTSLNLARLLVDGEQIVVGIRVPVLGGSGPSGGSGVGGSTTGGIASVALNTATADQLDTLPGIGPVTAQAILQWRADNGPFTSVDELLEVSGIGDATLSDIRPYVYV